MFLHCMPSMKYVGLHYSMLPKILHLQCMLIWWINRNLHDYFTTLWTVCHEKSIIPPAPTAAVAPVCFDDDNISSMVILTRTVMVLHGVSCYCFWSFDHNFVAILMFESFGSLKHKVDIFKTHLKFRLDIWQFSHIIYILGWLNSSKLQLAHHSQMVGNQQVLFCTHTELHPEITSSIKLTESVVSNWYVNM